MSLWPNNSKIEVLGLTGPYGSGKAQPLSSKVLTPNGWKTMGDMQPGDVVVNPEGGESRVLRIFPQGLQDVFRLEFSDGASARCTRDHLWLVRSDSYSKGSARPLSSLIGKPTRFWIPLVEPVQFSNSEPLPIDPYVLGVLIGDGCLSHGLCLSNPEKELQDYFSSRLPYPMHLTQKKQNSIDYYVVAGRRGTRENPLLTSLRELGIHGKKSVDKFIPEQYLFSSVWDRLELLRGICDTDGFATPGRCEFSTSSETLASQVRHLVWSLGGTAKLSWRVPSYTYDGVKKDGSVSYRVYIRLPDGMNPFRLSRKSNQYDMPRDRQRPTRRIVKIHPDGTEECQCILLDSENHLYVTDDYTVTHNTLFCLTVDPKHTLYYDFEKSGGTYDGLGATRIDAPSEMLKTHPNGFRPLQVFQWWIEHLRGVQVGQYRVIVLDTIGDIEAGLADWVKSRYKEFGYTSPEKFESMGGVFWKCVRDEWKSVLTQLAAKCETFAFTAHLRSVWRNGKPTSTQEPVGKQTLFELASLYLWLHRERRGEGNIIETLKVPFAEVLKSRLARTTIHEDGTIEIQPLLPPRIPQATPATLREYIANPRDMSRLKKDEKKVAQTLSDDDRLSLQAQVAEDERAVAEAKLEFSRRTEQAYARIAELAAAGEQKPNTDAAGRTSGVPAVEQPAMNATRTDVTSEPKQDAAARGFETPDGVSRDQLIEIKRLKDAAHVDDETYKKALAKFECDTAKNLSRDEATRLITWLDGRVKKQVEQAKAKDEFGEWVDKALSPNYQSTAPAAVATKNMTEENEDDSVPF